MPPALHEDIAPKIGPGDSPLHAAIGELALVDHHVHPAIGRDLTDAEFGALLTESDQPAAAGTSRFDSQLGFAIRRWCGPVLGLPPLAEPEDYLARRAELGAAEVNRRMLSASGANWLLIDTGYQRDGLLDLAGMAAGATAQVREIVRLEQVAEHVITAGDASAAGFAARFEAGLASRTARAVATKSIIGYRFGLDCDPEPPSEPAVAAAAGRWLRRIESGEPVRLTDPALLRFVLWSGLDRRLPVQIHTGFGDPQLDLRRCDPLLLRDFLAASRDRGVPVMLLHCYPYHRQAGYLAHVYPHVYLDVGLAINHVGARAAAIVAESLELAPFGKVLFSSDAFGPAELHYLGAALWRRSTAAVLGDWVRSGEWSTADAIRVAQMIGAENARRVYRLE